MTSKLHLKIYMRLLTVLALICLVLSASCLNRNASGVADEVPKYNLWAWERPEDLSFLAGKNNVGVAYLAQTILVNGEEIELRRRMQPLKIPDGIFLTAVTRIETGRGTNAAVFSASQINEIEALVTATAGIKNVKAVQVDFDAAKSERKAYVTLLKQVRPALPKGMPLSITAIASWCLGDIWFDELPVDDVVPMVFEMGSDDVRVRRFLSDGKDWSPALCKNSYGVSNYDPIDNRYLKDRRIYFFNNRSWKASDFDLLLGDK